MYDEHQRQTAPCKIKYFLLNYHQEFKVIQNELQSTRQEQIVDLI